MNQVPPNQRNRVILKTKTVYKADTNYESSKDTAFWCWVIVFLILGLWLCIPCLFCCFPMGQRKRKKAKCTTEQVEVQNVDSIIENFYRQIVS